MDSGGTVCVAEDGNVPGIVSKREVEVVRRTYLGHRYGL